MAIGTQTRRGRKSRDDRQSWDALGSNRFQVDYSKRVTVPIRDMHNPLMPIVFVVDVYGWDRSDFMVIPGGSAPLVAAVKRLKLDPERYQATIWDAAGVES